MSYIKSVSDKLSEALSPVTRKLEDANVGWLGTKVQCMRIALSDRDIFGEQVETYETQLINNAIIKHPFSSNVQLFGSYDEATQTLNSSSIDLMEFLPIEIRIPFTGESVDTPISLKRGDLLVECLRDEHGNKIPFIMQITRVFGAFSMKQIVGKHYEAALYRGDLTAEVKRLIDIYLQGE